LIGELSERGRDHLLASTTDAVRSATLGHLATSALTHDDLRLALRRAVRAACRASQGVTLHAAGAVADGRGLLFPADSGSGKSTLVVALARERADAVISDDLVVVDGSVMQGFGIPITVRTTSPYRSIAADLWYADTSDRLLVRSEDVGGRPGRSRAPIHAIIFPQFDASRTPERRSMSAAQTFGRMMASVVDPTDDGRIDQLATLCALVPAYRISYPDVASSLRLLDELQHLPSVASPPPVWLTNQELEGATVEIRGVRFGDDEVVLFHSGRGEGAVLSDCPVGATIPLASWSALTSGRRCDTWTVQ
jgi:hypothetical protein